MKKRTMPSRTISTSVVPRAIQRRFPHVTKVTDAVRAIEIDVTEADGGDGIGSDFEQCALARAACRQQHADHALVSKRVVYIIKKDTAIRYAANERVRQEIVSYDRHHDFAPGRYTLRPKRPSELLGAPHRYTREDPRARHDATGPRWVPAPRVRDLNAADVVDAVPAKKKKARR